MSNAVALDNKKSILVTMANKYGMEANAFDSVIMNTLMPKGATKENVAAFLVVANEYGLNPLTKEIYAFPTQGGAIQPVVSVDGWINLANSHPQCDGIELEDIFDNKGEFIAVKSTIHRKDRKFPTIVTEYLRECYKDTPQWKQKPRRMTRHRALIQGSRIAFGFAGIVDHDEYERMVDITPIKPTIAPPPPPPPHSQSPSAPLHGYEVAKTVVWDEDGVIEDTSAQISAPVAPAPAPPPPEISKLYDEQTKWFETLRGGVMNTESLDALDELIQGDKLIIAFDKLTKQAQGTLKLNIDAKRKQLVEAS